jgi:hypothetical protein
MRTAFVLLLFLLPTNALAQAAAPLDETAMRAFADRLVALANAGDCAGVEQMLDVTALVARGLEGIPLRGQERMSLGVSVSQSIMRPSVGVLALACEGTARGRRVVYRGRTSLSGREVVRFRIVQRQGAVTFFDLELARNRSGDVVAVDLFQAMLGLWTSQEVRDQAVPMGGADTAFARSLDARGRLLAANMHTIREAMNAASAGDVGRADAAVSSLPPLLRDDPSMLRLRISAAQVAGDLTAYRRALDDFLRLHPENVAARTFALDHGFMRRDFAGALDALGHLEQLIGRDPALELARAGLLSQLGRQADAASAAIRAANGDPESIDAWLMTLSLCAAEGRHADAARAYVALVRLRSLPADFGTNPLFARFRVSPELRAAMTTR